MACLDRNVASTESTINSPVGSPVTVKSELEFGAGSRFDVSIEALLAVKSHHYVVVPVTVQADNAYLIESFHFGEYERTLAECEVVVAVCCVAGDVVIAAVCQLNACSFRCSQIGCIGNAPVTVIPSGFSGDFELVVSVFGSEIHYGLVFLIILFIIVKE